MCRVAYDLSFPSITLGSLREVCLSVSALFVDSQLLLDVHSIFKVAINGICYLLYIGQ